MTGVQPKVVLELTRAEALVLFEWLAKVDQAGRMPVEHPSEEQVLWRIEGQLESALTEPFSPDYKELLTAARKEVSGSQQ